MHTILLNTTIGVCQVKEGAAEEVRLCLAHVLALLGAGGRQLLVGVDVEPHHIHQILRGSCRGWRERPSVLAGIMCVKAEVLKVIDI